MKSTISCLFFLLCPIHTIGTVYCSPVIFPRVRFISALLRADEKISNLNFWLPKCNLNHFLQGTIRIPRRIPTTRMRCRTCTSDTTLFKFTDSCPLEKMDFLSTFSLLFHLNEELLLKVLPTTTLVDIFRSFHNCSHMPPPICIPMCAYNISFPTTPDFKHFWVYF